MVSSRFPDRLTILRITFAILGLFCIGVGSLVAYDNYEHRRAIEACLSGKACSIPFQTTFDLSASLKNADVGLVVGIVLAVLGAVIVVYTLVFASRRSVQPLGPSDTEASSEELEPAA